MYLLCSLSAHSGPSDFNPGNPPEPETGFALTLSCDSIQAGSVTGVGHYHTGTRVSLSATSNDHYVFSSWKEGETEISSSATFTYTMPDRDVHLTAHFEYRQMYLLSLATVPTAISTTSGGGFYEKGKSVTVASSEVSGYEFMGWWEGDSLLSAALSFRFEIKDRSTQLIARYKYNPSNPGDPNSLGAKHRLYMIAQPANGGYFANASGVQIREGETMPQYAYSNTNFVFDGWFHKDTLFARSTNLNYTMGTADDTLTAHYHFDPSSPGDPNPGATAKYNLSAIKQTAALGSKLAFPVYLQNDNIGILSATFEMTFPAGILVDYLHVSLSSRSNGHALTCDSLGNNLYRFIVSHDTLAPFAGSSGILLTVPVTLPTDWEAGSTHSVLFSNATLGTASGQVSCPVLNGSIGVTALVSTLYASFYTDIYLNRVLFSNLSSENATTFSWDFGDGQNSTEKSPMHVYAAGGSYEVTLSASDGTETKTLKMLIDISNENLWAMTGYYTLNKHKSNVKNFTTGFDLFKTLSRCAVTGNIFIQVENGETFDTPLDSTLHALISKLAVKIVRKDGPILTFFSDSVQNIPLLDFSGTLHRPYVETVMSTATHFSFEKVEMAFSGLKLNPTELHALSDIELCSGHETPPVDMSGVGNQFTINWQLLKTPLYLSGQLESGTIRIPAMTLLNDTTFTDSLTYRIQLVSNNYVFFSKDIKYVVLASIYVLPTLLEPASNTIIEVPIVTFKWKAQGNVLYDLYLWESTTSMPVKPLISGAWTGTYTDNSHCIYGKSYKWRILAKSTCDSIWSVADSFNIGRLPDLAVESITFSDAEAYAGEAVDVHAVIRNSGGRINRFYWSDRLYLVSGINQQNKLALATTQGWRMLKTDSSYQVDFHAILPLDTVPYSNFMVVADYALNMPEISEPNNSKLSEPLHLKHYVLDSTEFEALKHVYENTNGENWTRPWNLSTKKLIAANWSGVGFQKGRLISIDLNENNLNGSLPADLFNMQYLTSLNMFNNKLIGKLDTLALAMKTHHYRSDSLTYLNLGANSMKGEISSFANRFPNLRTLYLQSNRFSEIDTVLSRKITNLNIQYQTFSHPDISLSMNPALEIPSLFWYKHETSELMRKDMSIYLMKNNNYLGWINYNASKFVMGLYNDWFYAPADSVELMINNNYFNGSRAKLHMNFSMGDANIDQKTNLLDIQHTLNRIFADYSYPFNRYAANTYLDNLITVQDIVSTVNLLLETGVVVDTTQNTIQRNESSGNFLFIANGELMLDIQEPVSALDLSLKNVRDKQLGMLLSNTDFQTMTKNTSDGIHFIIFSGSGKEIPAGMTALAQLSSEKAQIVSASIANKQAENVPVRIGDFPTDLDNGGLQTVQVYLNKSSVTLLMFKPYEHVTASLYNLQGQLINQQTLNQVTVGSHTMEYTHSLPSGAYLLTLIFQNGKSLQTKNYKWIVSK